MGTTAKERSEYKRTLKNRDMPNKTVHKGVVAQPASLASSNNTFNPIRHCWQYFEEHYDLHPEKIQPYRTRKLGGRGILHTAIMTLYKAPAVRIRLSTNNEKLTLPIDKIEILMLLCKARRHFEAKELTPPECASLIHCCRQIFSKYSRMADDTRVIHWRYLHEVRKAVKRCQGKGAKEPTSDLE